MPYPIRPIAPDELRAFAQVWERAFHFDEKEEELELVRKVFEFDRSFVALDGDRFVGTGGADSFDLTVPGGHVPTGGLTAIAVSPTHRRRGILSDMIRYHFDEVRSRGEPLSVLRASESIIYGRYGYGVAAEDAYLKIDRRHADFGVHIPVPGTVTLIDKDEAVKRFPAVYEAVAVTWPGFLSRSPKVWEMVLADLEHWRDGRTSSRYAVYEQDGETLGYLSYQTKGTWVEGHARNELKVQELVGVTPAAEAALWRFCFSVDLVTEITTDARPTVELLHVLLADPRRLKVTRGDGLWARVLDVPAALSRRRYSTSGRLTIGVRDPFFDDRAYRLEGGPDGADCRPTTGEPDITVDVAGLSARYLGAGSFRLLHQAGRVEGDRAAVRLADRMFDWDIPPWCLHYF